MKELIRRYYQVLAYLFFGVATTIVNIIVYFICQNTLGIDYKVSNAISWFLAVLFAFFTNKYFVFRSKNGNIKAFVKEFFLFYWYRLLSFVIDMAIMIVMVEWLMTSTGIAKLATQVVVVVVNYFFSKFFIFKKEHD